MQRAIKFRRRIVEAGIVLLLLLLVAFAAGIRAAFETRTSNRWVAHTQQVLREAATLRLSRSRMQTELWFYRATGKQEYVERYQTDRQKLLASANQLKKLTGDNGTQNEIIMEVTTILDQQITLLDAAIVQAEADEKAGIAQEFKVIVPANERLPRLMDQFEEEENRLFTERSASLQKNAQWAMNLLVAIAIVACGSLLFAIYYVQKEILLRAQIEGGLRRAKELLGMKLNQQQSELDHASHDLHAQILARNQVEEDLRKLNGELEERVAHRTTELAEMNRELESFNYSVSHDLRAPIRHMDGFSRILEEEFGPQLSPEARHYLQRIRLAAGQMSALVDDLLQLARLGRQPVKCQVISLENLVKEAITDCEQDERNHEIIWRVSRLPEVEGDAGLLRQVLTNLISNALKFSRKKEQTIVEIGSTQEGPELTVFVKDNGAGFDPRFADKLFGVFQRLHRQDEFEGTGIGLAIVARVIHKHGGRVWAESEPDRGATFYFTLTPTRQEAEAKMEPIGANA